MTRTDAVQKIVDSVKYRDWLFHLIENGEGTLLQIRFWAHDKASHHLTAQHGRKWYLSPYATKSEIIQTCFLAILVALEHEAREEFTFKGEAIFGPHFDCEELRELAEKKLVDIRAEKALGV